MSRRRQRLIAVLGAAVVLAALVPAVALTQGPEPQPGFAESLCPRAASPDPDCRTIAIPAEVWATATTIPIKGGQEAVKAYDKLIPKPYFALPGRRELGVLMFRLETSMSPAHNESTDPGAGYAEGTVAIRVGFPAKDGYPYREGWWVIAQPLNDQSQYGAGRGVGLPKYMADAGLRIDAGGAWHAHAEDWGRSGGGPPGAQKLPGGSELRIDWSKKPSSASEERRRQLWTWGQYGDPLFVQTRPYDEPGSHDPALVKFTPVSTVPLAGAPQTPITMAPDPRIGTAKVKLEGKTPGGVEFSKLIDPGQHEVAGTSAFTRGFAFITSDNLKNNQAARAAAEKPKTAAGCAGPAPGGEWRTFGRDLRNTRTQPAEEAIEASNVGSLKPEFVFDTTRLGAGTVHATPIVADGCVFFGTAGAPREGEEGTARTGWVFALNAESGNPVWKKKLAVGEPGLLCTGIIGSTPVKSGRVFAIVSQAGSPYAVALDRRNGKLLWKTVLDRTPKVYNCGSPVVFDGIVLAPFTGDQTGPTNRGGYSLLDARTGKILAKQYTIPQDDFAKGYKGGGIWTTAAVDQDTKYAYFGTANPDAGSPEHKRTNSIIKVDIDRRRATFGKIVDSYKGNPDRYSEEFPGAPLPCDPDHRLSPYIRSVLCAQMDLDFGSSPNLLRGPRGERWVGAMQKSGVFHVARAGDMKRVWTSVLGPPVFYGNGSTAATDGSSLFVAASPPGQMAALKGSTGTPRWVMPIADLIHYQEVMHANGLVYTNDAKGLLHIFRADNGLLAGQRWIGGDIGKPIYAEESSGSTALARNTLYVAASNYLVAYRGPRSSGKGGDSDDGKAPSGSGKPRRSGDRDEGPVRGQTEAGGGGSLPFTGLGLAGLLAAGVGLLVTGGALRRRARAR